MAIPVPAAIALPFALTVGRYVLKKGAELAFKKYGAKTVQAALKHPQVKKEIVSDSKVASEMQKASNIATKKAKRKDLYKEKRGQLEYQRPGDPKDIGRVTGPRDVLNPPRVDRPLEFA